MLGSRIGVSEIQVVTSHRERKFRSQRRGDADGSLIAGDRFGVLPHLLETPRQPRPRIGESRIPLRQLPIELFRFAKAIGENRAR